MAQSRKVGNARNRRRWKKHLNDVLCQRPVTNGLLPGATAVQLPIVAENIG